MKNENIFIWKDGGVLINAELAFTFHQQHGFPVEMYGEMVNERLPPKSYLRGYHITKAYDEAHRTNYLETYIEVIYRDKCIT